MAGHCDSTHSFLGEQLATVVGPLCKIVQGCPILCRILGLHSGHPEFIDEFFTVCDPVLDVLDSGVWPIYSHERDSGRGAGYGSGVSSRGAADFAVGSWSLLGDQSVVKSRAGNSELTEDADISLSGTILISAVGVLGLFAAISLPSLSRGGSD